MPKIINCNKNEKKTSVVLIIANLFASSQSGSCVDPAKKDKHEGKIVQVLCHSAKYGEQDEIQNRLSNLINEIEIK